MSAFPAADPEVTIMNSWTSAEWGRGCRTFPDARPGAARTRPRTRGRQPVSPSRWPWPVRHQPANANTDQATATPGAGASG